METNIISERIRLARESIGITKAEASRRLNLSKIGYCRYEYGERTPSLQTLEVIARCFNTSVDYLTGKCNDISPDFVVINKDDNNELFELVCSLQSSDNDSIKQLLAYYKDLTQKHNS